MNRILFIILLSIASTMIQAQVPSCNAPTPYKEQAALMLQNIDKSQVTTGTLYEEVFPWADVDMYDATSNTDTSTNLHYFQAYSELYYSSYNQANYTHPNDYETNVLNFHSDKEYHHPIGIIDFDYNVIHPDAVANGWFSVNNNQLYDNPSRPQSPYLTKRAFLSSVLQANYFEDFYNGTHYFHFDPSFVLTNRGFQLTDYEYIDFILDGVLLHREYIGSSNYITVPVSFPEPIEDTEGTLSIVYRTDTGNNEVARIKLKRKVKRNLTPCNGGTQLEITGPVYDVGYGEAAYEAQGKGYIFFADGNCANQVVKKPIIFVDGFDPDNGRDVWKIWEANINAVIVDNNGNDVKFGDELRSIGNDYDVIIYDYDETGINRGGAGFIENNGVAFTKFLDSLYSKYESTIEQDFIIVAPSMAALVVRFGLAWAEQNNIDHHTALYLSLDGPHQGAHVTAGVQQFVDLLTQYGGLKKWDFVKNSLHHSNAAKQMLLNHSFEESETVQAHPYRQIFLNNLATVGSYPQNLRKVAISDGNRNGILKNVTDHGYEPCDEVLGFAIKKRLRPRCSSPSCYKLKVDTFAQTDATRCETIDFTVKTTANLLQQIFTSGNFETFKSYSQPVYTNKSYDKSPGGMFGGNAGDINETLNKWYVKTLSWIFVGNVQNDVNNLPTLNFVPTISSVDYTFPSSENYDIYKNFQGINLSKCAGTTPFDTVYAMPVDFNHARFEATLLEALRDEIYNLKPKSTCNGDCPDYISLSEPIAPNSNVEYKAHKAINLLPDFSVDNSSVFKADIGCESSSIALASLGYLPKPKLPISLVASACPFDWDVANNQVICGSGFTTFKVFVKNIDVNTYAEFSTNGTSWSRANIGDKGWTININANSGQPQVFYSRPKNDPTNVIQGWLSHCP